MRTNSKIDSGSVEAIKPDGLGSMCYVLRAPDGGVYVIDAGHPRDVHRTVDAVNAATGADRVKAVLLTHGHADHVGAVSVLQQSGAQVWAGGNRTNLRLLAQEQSLGLCPAPYNVDRLLQDGDRIELADDTLVALRTPGHSDDHVAYFLERQRVLFCGDLFTFQDIGTCDIAYPHSQSLERMSQSVRRCAALSPACVAPGHGRLTHRPERLFSAVEKRFELFARNPSMMVAHTILPLIVLLVEAREGATVDQLRSDTERHAPLFSDFLAGLQGVESDLDKLLLILAMKGIVSIENSRVYLRRDALGQAA